MAAEDYIDMCYDGYSQGETDCGPESDAHRYEVWVSKDGTATEVSAMTDSHIVAILRMFDRWEYLNDYWDGWYAALEEELERRHGTS